MTLIRGVAALDIALEGPDRLSLLPHNQVREEASAMSSRLIKVCGTICLAPLFLASSPMCAQSKTAGQGTNDMSVGGDACGRLGGSQPVVQVRKTNSEIRFLRRRLMFIFLVLEYPAP